MSSEFSARQTLLNSSSLERLINRPSSRVAALASLVGWHGLPGQLANLDVGGAINVLVLSIAEDNGVEADAMRKWLPRLRSEALLLLGCNLSNWAYQGPPGEEMAFNAKLFGGQAGARAEAGRMLGVNLADAGALVRYHSGFEVECVTNEQLGSYDNRRAPRFAIYASTLADRVQAVSSGALFTAIPKISSWA